VKQTLRKLLTIGSCLLAFTTASYSSDLRLSRTLIPDEYADAGLKQLTSDQVGILDALVRRDIEASKRTVSSKEPRAERFSERLTSDERNNAGLTSLSESQLEKLDNYVARLTAPVGSMIGSFATGETNGPYVSVKTLKRAPEIHGAVSLMYGVGSGGYSERGGAMVLTYDDPSGISVAFAYSEIRTKGGSYYRHCDEGFHDGFGAPAINRSFVAAK
jgi:hypothetical protein